MDSMPACYCWTALCTALPAWGLGACTTGLGFGAFCVQSSNSRARPRVQLGSAQSLARDWLFVPCSLFRVTKTKTDTGHEQAMNTRSSSGPGRQGGSRGRRGQQEMHLRESPTGSGREERGSQASEGAPAPWPTQRLSQESAPVTLSPSESRLGPVL